MRCRNDVVCRVGKKHKWKFEKERFRAYKNGKFPNNNRVKDWNEFQQGRQNFTLNK